MNVSEQHSEYELNTLIVKKIYLLMFILFLSTYSIKSQEMESSDNPPKGAPEDYIDFGDSIYDFF